MNAWSFLYVLLSVSAMDVVWIWCVRATSQHLVGQAVVASVLMVLLGAVLTVAYVDYGYAAVVPACIGTAAGTVVGMKIKIRRG